MTFKDFFANKKGIFETRVYLKHHRKIFGRFDGQKEQCATLEKSKLKGVKLTSQYVCVGIGNGMIGAKML